MSSAKIDLARYPVWRELALLLAAKAARDDGRGEPGQWLAETLLSRKSGSRPQSVIL